MSHEEFIIDGAKFSSTKGFYKYIEKQFKYGLNWRIGRNLNAFEDVLRGGFGKHDCGDKIIVEWKNLSKSRERLESSFLNKVLEILDQNSDIILVVEDHKLYHKTNDNFGRSKSNSGWKIQRWRNSNWRVDIKRRHSSEC